MKQKLLFLLTALCFGFVSGVKADATYVYFNDFETTSEKTATGTATGSEKVDATIQGSGSFNNEGGFFGKVFQNVRGENARSNYLLLPDDALSHSADSKALTIGFWVNKKSETDFYWSPIFTAYGSAPNPNNGTPMFWTGACKAVQYNVGDGNWCDFTGAQSETSAWLDDGNWHYYTVTFNEGNVKVYIDGVVANSWTLDNTTEGQKISTFYTNTTAYSYICLGGNQRWDFTGNQDKDPAFAYDDLYITNVALTQAEIDKIIADKYYSYSVKAYDGSHNLLKQIASGTYTGTDITVAYPQYIQDGTTLYNIPQNGSGDYFRTTFTPDADNYEKELTYNGSTVSDVYLYIEGEDISGISQANYTARASYGKMGYTSNISTFVSVANLPAGTYQIYARPVRTNNGDATCKFKVGEEEKFSMTMQKGAYDIQNSEPFTIESAQALSIACEGSSTSGLDWLYLKGTPKYKVIGATDCSTDYLTETSEKRTLVSGNSYHYSFINHNKTGNWNSWNTVFCVWNGSAEEAKLVIRLDRWEDKKGNYDGFAISENWDWDTFFSEMEGAKIDATVSYSGNVMTLRYDITTASDESWWMTYNSSTAGAELSGNIQIALSVSHSWLELMEEGPVATIGSTGWTTFASAYPLDLGGMSASTGDVKAYYASSVGDGKIVMTSTESEGVAAGTGLMLKGTAGATVTIPVAISGTGIVGNMLVGCTTEIPVAASETCYVLINNDGTAEFQSLKTNGATIPAGKAYLNTGVNSTARLIISFDDEDPTAINAIEAAEAENGALKDGKYLIDGKIVLVKNGVKYGANGQKLN